MFNKEAFVQTTDQEFSWTMTHDGSGPLPAKQWFCFKFLCHSCFSKTSVIWGCPGPQGAIMRLDMALESRKILFSLNVRYLFMQGLRVSSSCLSEKNERSCTANTLWVSFQCMECTTCACATHLQNTVFGEVCAVDGVFHFVFAVQGAQRGWTKVPCNFLSDGNIWIITCSLALHFNIKLSEFGAVTPSLSWCQSLWTVVKVKILYRQSDYSAAEHVILWRKWQNRHSANFPLT